MTTFSLVVIGLSTAYHWWISFIMDTKGARSTFIFKMIPFGLGLVMVGVILFEMGMIVLPGEM